MFQLTQFQSGSRSQIYAQLLPKLGAPILRLFLLLESHLSLCLWSLGSPEQTFFRQSEAVSLATFVKFGLVALATTFVFFCDESNDEGLK
jgi:hypothetical protein